MPGINQIYTIILLWVCVLQEVKCTNNNTTMVTLNMDRDNSTYNGDDHLTCRIKQIYWIKANDNVERILSGHNKEENEFIIAAGVTNITNFFKTFRVLGKVNLIRYSPVLTAFAYSSIQYVAGAVPLAIRDFCSRRNPALNISFT